MSLWHLTLLCAETQQIFAPFLVYSLHNCHTYMCQIVKKYLILDKDNDKTHNAVLKWWFNKWWDKSYPNLSVSVWQTDCLLNLITGCATLQSINCMFVISSLFQITVKEFWPTPLCVFVLIKPQWRVWKHERSCKRFSGILITNHSNHSLALEQFSFHLQYLSDTSCNQVWNIT